MSLGAGSENRVYIKSVFDSFDKDASGSINAVEFRDLCVELGYYFAEEELGQMFAIASSNQDNMITFDEFIEFWKNSGKFNIADPQKLQLYRNALQLFRQYDLDNSGHITINEYQQLSKSANWGLSEEQLHAMLAKVDKDNDGTVSFTEFVSWLNWGL